MCCREEGSFLDFSFLKKSSGYVIFWGFYPDRLRRDKIPPREKKNYTNTVLALSANAANASLFNTAKSANTFRSISMPALCKPLMKRL